MFLGHQKQWQFLKKLANSKNIPHALLFCGQKNLGKKKVAEEFLKLILPSGSLDSNPDLILIDGTQEIKIAQIRELCWRLSLKPCAGLFKAAILSSAEAMNEQSQNCFLKTLEEPKGNTILILLTEHPERLLPTIISRCQKIKFYPVKKKEIEDYLISQGLDEEKANAISKISLCRPEMAITLMKEPQRLVLLKQRLAKLKEMTSADFSEKFDYAKDLSNEPELKEILNVWLFYFRNMLIKAISADGNSSRLPDALSRQAIGGQVSKIKKIIEQIQKTIFLITSTNVNKRLALEILLMEI